ncbi:hypothetical protein IC582_014894 [Cucumis melo]
MSFPFCQTFHVRLPRDFHFADSSYSLDSPSDFLLARLFLFTVRSIVFVFFARCGFLLFLPDLCFISLSKRLPFSCRALYLPEVKIKEEGQPETLHYHVFITDQSGKMVFPFS